MHFAHSRKVSESLCIALVQLNIQHTDKGKSLLQTKDSKLNLTGKVIQFLL